MRMQWRRPSFRHDNPEPSQSSDVGCARISPHQAPPLQNAGFGTVQSRGSAPSASRAASAPCSRACSW
eukprot:5927347-Prymnesium_polylepis.2